MAVSITVTSRTVNQTTGAISYQFSDGSGIEFASEADAAMWADVPGLEAQMQGETLKRILVVWSRGNGNQTGKEATFDATAASGIVVRTV